MGQLISMGACPFCGGGNKTPCFATYDDGFHCYTCGKHKSADKKAYAFAPVLKSETLKQTKLPKIHYNTCEFGISVLQWLYKYYVFDDLIKKYNIGYCEYSEFGPFKGESLILPFYDDKKELIFWQQRFFPNKMFRTSGSKNYPFKFLSNTNTKQIILVEDFISAIRVAKYANALCLQGVKLNYNSLLYLINLNLDIMIWLDPDHAGHSGAKEIFKKIITFLKYKSTNMAFAVREPRIVKILMTDKQPKEYNDYELYSLLRGNDETIKTN